MYPIIYSITHPKQAVGFTLIELSIVLIIIGLIVGGVLVGQDLIEAAKARSVVSDIERVRTAVYTFRNKYNGLPGDLKNAETFWGSDASCPNTPTNTTPKEATCNGNGDRKLGIVGQADNYENFRFWQHLANAGLIEGPYTGVTGNLSDWHVSPFNSLTGIDNALYWVHYDPTSTGGGDWFAARGDNMILSGESRTAIDGGLYRPAYRPLTALSIDTKMDDGKPGTGKVLGTRLTSGNAPGCATTDSEATAIYAVTSGDRLCILEFIQLF